MTANCVLKVCSIFVAILAAINPLCSQGLRIANCNILNFPDALGLERIDDLRAVFDYIQPDMLGVQEMLSQYGSDLFLDSVLNYQNAIFAAVPFHDGPDTDNSLFYRTDKVEVVATEYIPTPLRDIAEYTLRIASSQTIFNLYLIHFKASQGAENESLRLQEATILRNHLDSLAAGRDFLVTGDFNFYYDEAGFHRLIDSTSNNGGRVYDPLNAIGQWHDNIDYASIHTQSSRVENLPDGGASGGLDDRFDMVLCSRSLLDSSGMYMDGHAYTIFGNDGNHFNQAVNDGINQVIPSYIADALYYASDHLPVYVDMIEASGGIAIEGGRAVIHMSVVRDRARVMLPYFADFRKARINLYGVNGQRIYSLESKNQREIILDIRGLPSGVYFCYLQIETARGVHHFKTKFARIK